MSPRLSPLLLVLCLAAALLAAGPAAAAERTVAVSGSATLALPNDTAAVGLGVNLERRSRGAALRAVSARLRRVIAAVQQVPGVGPGDVVTGRISVRRSWRGERTAFRASEGIRVTLHQPDQAGRLVSAAIAAGATGVSGPTYFVGDAEAAYGRALGAAFLRARAKAAALAAQAGAALGPAVTIEEGGSPESVEFEGPTSKDGKAALPPPTKPGSSRVTARVRVVFALI